MKDTSCSQAWKVNQERKKHRDQRLEKEDVDREWSTKHISSFGAGWAPSDHKVRALGSRSGRLAFISPCPCPHGDARIQAEEEPWVSSEPTRKSHKASKEAQKGDRAQTGERRAGVLPQSEWWQCAQHCVSRFTAVETVSFFSLPYPLCPGLYMCINYLWVSEGSALYLRNLMHLGEGFISSIS